MSSVKLISHKQVPVGILKMQPVEFRNTILKITNGGLILKEAILILDLNGISGFLKIIPPNLKVNLTK